MSEIVGWIAAEGDQGKHLGTPGPMEGLEQVGANSQSSIEWQNLPAHNFVSPLGESAEAQLRDEAFERNPDLWLYRGRTLALLRRYLRFSLETGRLPSFAGQEFFRAKVTSYRAVTFEDRVIFVSDVERCMKSLHPWDQQLIVRIVFQEHSHDDAARILHCCRKTIQRRVPEVLDLLSEVFLKVGLLVDLPGRRRD